QVGYRGLEKSPRINYGVTVSVTGALCTIVPQVAETVMVYVPLGVPGLLPPALTRVGLNAHEVNAGNPEHVTTTSLGKTPDPGSMATVNRASRPADTELLDGVAPMAKSKFGCGMEVNVTAKACVTAALSLPIAFTLKL